MATKDWVAKTSDVPEAARRQWRADRALRPPMRSPGRPEPSRAVQRQFWRLIGTGITSAEAALRVGVSWPVGTRWFRHAGGMPPISLDEPSGRYLSFDEREEIAILRAQGKGVREIASSLGRNPGTISRELRRNAATRSGRAEYRATVAQWKAQQAAKRPKTAKLVSNPRLHEYVQERLAGNVRRPDGSIVVGPEPPEWKGLNKPQGMAEWQNRPLDRVYPVVFIDCIHVKVRDGQVANRPIYVALAVTVDGNRDILGLWAGDGGEGAKYWQHVLTEIKNRGVEDVLMLVCDGLKGLPDAVGNVWSRTIVQTCVVHLIRGSFRYAARQDWDKLARALKPIYTADTAAAAEDRFLEFTEEWGRKYPAIVKLWSDAWAEFVPFLQFDKEIRRIVCTTNAIESVNARIRKAVKARGHFPNEQAALKCVYLAIMALDPTGKGRARWTQRWKGALNAFEITFDGRLSAGRH